MFDLCIGCITDEISGVVLTCRRSEVGVPTLSTEPLGVGRSLGVCRRQLDDCVRWLRRWHSSEQSVAV